jgi:fructose PTS system EIIBC or EIIC component
MNYYTIAETLAPESIETKLKSTTKAAVIQELLLLLDKSGKLKNYDDVLKKIHEREKIASTAIAGGIAMPHIKTNGVSHVCMAVGISRNGIPYDSPDGQQTKIFVLAASPDDPTSSYLVTLVNMIDEIKNQKVCDRMMDCETKEDIYQLLTKYEHKMYAIEETSNAQ